MALLEVKDLRAGYGDVPVLRGIDLSVQAGSITALIGANGAGKTTLLRTISGIIPADAGSVRYDGQCCSRPGAGRSSSVSGHARVRKPSDRFVVAERAPPA